MVYEGLTAEQNTYILNLYRLTKGTIGYTKKAIDLFEEKFGFRISRTTLYKKWKNAGFELQKHGGKRKGFDKKGFIELYKKCDGKLESMIKKTNYLKGSLMNLYRRHNLKPRE